jgi:hypothetical protein
MSRLVTSSATPSPQSPTSGGAAPPPFFPSLAFLAANHLAAAAPLCGQSARTASHRWNVDPVITRSPSSVAYFAPTARLIDSVNSVAVHRLPLKD